jgi:hypothetical protein
MGGAGTGGQTEDFVNVLSSEKDLSGKKVRPKTAGMSCRLIRLARASKYGEPFSELRMSESSSLPDGRRKTGSPPGSGHAMLPR